MVEVLIHRVLGEGASAARTPPQPEEGRRGAWGHRGFRVCFQSYTPHVHSLCCCGSNVPGGGAGGLSQRGRGQEASRDRDRHKEAKTAAVWRGSWGGYAGQLSGEEDGDFFERARWIGTSGGSRRGRRYRDGSGWGMVGVGPAADGRGSCMGTQGTQKEREWYVDLCRWRGRAPCVSSSHAVGAGTAGTSAYACGAVGFQRCALWGRMPLLEKGVRVGRERERERGGKGVTSRRRETAGEGETRGRVASGGMSSPQCPGVPSKGVILGSYSPLVRESESPVVRTSWIECRCVYTP